MTRKPRQTRRGTAAVELAVLLPFLVLLLFGVWEVGRALDVATIVENAAAVGGRQASTGTFTNAQVNQVVVNYLQSAGLPTQNAVVTVSDLTSSGTDVSQANEMDKIQVTLSIPFRDVRWGVSGFIINNNAQLTGTAIYYSARGNPYPTNIQVPPAW